MGLSISVGLLYDQARNDPEGYEHHRRAFLRLGRALCAEGVRWEEPEVATPPSPHVFSGGFPYGHLTRLRRILVLAGRGEPVAPAPRPDSEAWRRDLARIDDETSLLASHLLCHADNAGYYLPVDFADPLFLAQESGVAGAQTVGSSHRLLAELDGLAPTLGIRLTEAHASHPGPAAPAVSVDLSDDDPFGPEKWAWDQLRQACRASIAGGHAVVFH
ncbi:hypothetical protein [Streptomyces sp. NPDC001508]|uniref:hypothetical protein n=1 Tax=Streptomyces sp. NPDC001508 TaxID=3154656 RepID=UPI003317854A